MRSRANLTRKKDLFLRLPKKKSETLSPYKIRSPKLRVVKHGTEKHLAFFGEGDYVTPLAHHLTEHGHWIGSLWVWEKIGFGWYFPWMVLAPPKQANLTKLWMTDISRLASSHTQTEVKGVSEQVFWGPVLPLHVSVFGSLGGFGHKEKLKFLLVREKVKQVAAAICCYPCQKHICEIRSFPHVCW